MLILPQSIKQFITTNLAQPFQVWNSATEYALDTAVVYDNHIYRTIVDKNLGVQPDLNTGKWLLYGVDNAFASIDLNSSTASVIDDNLEYIEYYFDAVNFTYLAFGSIKGSRLEIYEYNSEDVQVGYTDITIGTDRICAIHWYNYYYCGIPDGNALGRGLAVDYLHDTIQGTTAKIRVRIWKNVDDEAEIKSMVGGTAYDIGETQFGLNVRVVDYSTKTTDVNGITTLERRRSREIMESRVLIDAKDTQAVKRIIKGLLGTVNMFIAEEAKDSNYDNLLLLGFIDEFSYYINNGVYTEAKLITEEVL